MSNIHSEIYDEKCKRLFEEDTIRFAGILDEKGEIISGGFKPGLTPLEGDAVKLKSFMEFVSKTSIRKEFDQSLGPINYLAARRDKAVLISFPFPVSRITLLISAEPSANIEILAAHVVEIFSGIE
ncbi:MAG: hypothetical protein NPMRTHETA2_960007 [Nitrosopumilales archaeon]|nr:MAG: hypothetical protein NPMRTHETA2_960007 [Nitrosopumilales archaeon]MCH7648525.1 hypothetical protein [Nitrososphaerota archaeon]